VPGMREIKGSVLGRLPYYLVWQLPIALPSFLPSSLHSALLARESVKTSVDPSPVLLLQANFIIGGLLLTIVASHSTIDTVGQGQVIRLLSKACRNKPFTDNKVVNGNLDRHNLISLLDDSWRPKPKPVDTKIKDIRLQQISVQHQRLQQISPGPISPSKLPLSSC